MDRFRPLTLRNKRIVEWFDAYYNRLHEIDGEAGFNYPRISQYFYSLALSTIDADEEDSKQFFDKADYFISSARNYTPVIDDINLFRKK